MQRFQWAIVMLILVLAQCAYADSVLTFNITHASVPIFPNEAGDNEFFTFSGPAGSMSGGGTAVCAWCVEGTPFAPGSSLNPNIDILTFDSVQGNLRFGGQTHDVLVLFNSSIGTDFFTFPTNGKSTFTVSLPAFLNPVMGEVDTGQFFNLQIPLGKLALTFTLVPAQNGFPAFYQFSKGSFALTTVPEPGTLGLMATGLAGIIGMIRRKRKRGKLEFMPKQLE
jgi:PEP-CTERM motif-containing protein